MKNWLCLTWNWKTRSDTDFH